MPFACIYVPNFPVAAALRAEPELKTRALAILEGKPPLEKIFAVNEHAVREGITPGMTKAQAELCADIALRPRSAVHESAAHAALLDCAQSFSPCVEDAACDTALLDLAGMESLLGSLPEISRAIHTRAAALGLAANVAIASNPDAAMLAARGLYSDGSCGAGAPARAAITVIPPGKEAEQLRPLSVEVLFTNRTEEAEKKSAALLETLTPGASAICTAWPRCRKFPSVNASDRKVCACSNWRAGPWCELWFRLKNRCCLKKPSNWITPSSCSNR